MDTNERESKRLSLEIAADILGKDSELPHFTPADVLFLLSELDAACKALHDLREETGYAEGVKAERERCVAIVRRSAQDWLRAAESGGGADAFNRSLGRLLEHLADGLANPPAPWETTQRAADEAQQILSADGVPPFKVGPWQYGTIADLARQVFSGPEHTCREHPQHDWYEVAGPSPLARCRRCGLEWRR